MKYIFTDGSCSGNPGVGSFGILVIENAIVPKLSEVKLKYLEKIEEITSGPNMFIISENETTSNIAELNAIILAFKYLDINLINAAIIYTDSQYVSKGYNEWMPGWIKNNWINSNKKEVMNLSLWKQLEFYSKKYLNVSIIWTRAHTNLKDFESLCNKLIDSAVQKSTRQLKLHLEKKEQN